MTAYYNEFDPYAAQWLRNLITAGHIADGVVDERSIVDVRPEDLIGFTQCHFFAGLGGWSHALRLAGWPDDRPVWTGSPPCQPFSVAGNQLGVEDARHLAPTWLDLVTERQPPIVFGEQVEAAVKKDEWLDDLQNHLEAVGYATGAGVIPACGLGAAHIRKRLWFVAERVEHPHGERCGGGYARIYAKTFHGERHSVSTGRGVLSRLAQPHGDRPHSPQGDEAEQSSNGADDGVLIGSSEELRGAYDFGGLANSKGARGCGRESLQNREHAERRGSIALESDGRQGPALTPTGPTNGLWRDADWLFCRDGKWRPVEPGTFPLANGVPNRVGRLRAYGNAIVPQVAAEFISAFMSVENSIIPVEEVSFL